MNGVTFGTKHSYDDFGLILSSKSLTLPEPQTESVSIVGRNGDLDLTSALTDEVTFKNRTWTFTFTMLDAINKWKTVLSSFANFLHGKRMQMILDDEKNFYWYGRWKINEFSTNKTLGTIVVKGNVEPYKLEVNAAGAPWLWDPFSLVDGVIHKTTVTVSGSETVNLINLAKVVSPTFTCTAAMKVTYNGTTYSLPTGKTTVYDIRLKEGDNYVTFTGTGTVTIAYKGGSL